MVRQHDIRTQPTNRTMELTGLSVKHYCVEGTTPPVGGGEVWEYGRHDNDDVRAFHSEWGLRGTRLAATTAKHHQRPELGRALAVLHRTTMQSPLGMLPSAAEATADIKK